MKFKAYAITNEIDLNKIANRCDIPKKYTWEEPLILQEQVLSLILGHQVEKFQQILIFAFGSIIFINVPLQDESTFFDYLKSVQPDLDLKTYEQYFDNLDKPDITWTNSDAGLFYERMSEFFELNDRYTILKQKTDILNVIVGHFSSISHSIRGLFVEWLIYVLILVEVVLMIADLLK